MDDLPTELHLKIYRIACRDDGTTGTSLSSVSRRIRELSAEHRYQSVALCGPMQIQQFVECIRNVPPAMRRIRFLFMYDYGSLSGRPNGVTTTPLPSRSHRRPVNASFQDMDDLRSEMADLVLRFMRVSMWDEASDDDPELSKRAVQRDSVAHLGRNMVELLSLASPTLELLSLISFDTRTDSDGESPLQLLHGAFPALTHLTVRGPHELPRSPEFAPGLCTLHVTETNLSVPFVTGLPQNHPNLLRLRFSRVPDLGQHLGSIFCVLHVMRIFTSQNFFKKIPAPKQMPPAAGPSAVRALILEPANIPRRLPDRRQELLVQTLTLLNARSARFRFLPNYHRTMTAEAHLALRDWKQTVMGNPVPWGEKLDKVAWDVTFFTA
ncbi:hypothetical protein C8R43DRAFT_1064311 [Mycena crocata]|nr:hypothetical protein C8R43DRAFT_1064311 [Mycena crocata]